MQNHLVYQPEKEQVEIVEGDIRIVKQRHKVRTTKQEYDSTWYYLSRFGELGFTIAIPIVGGAILGKFIDERLGSRPSWTLIFIFAGVFFSLYLLINLFRDEFIKK